MTDFNFHIPTRYDNATAEEGVWFEVVDENEHSWGEFKCAMMDEDDRRIKLATDRLKQKFAKEIRTKTVDVKVIQRELFLAATLQDWRGVKDGKGKEVPFGAEAARAYFETPAVSRFVLPHLLDYAQDVRNYRGESKDDIAGN